MPDTDQGRRSSGFERRRQSRPSPPIPSEFGVRNRTRSRGALRSIGPRDTRLAAHPDAPDRLGPVDERAEERAAARRTLIAFAAFLAILVPLVVIAAVVLQGPGAISIHDSATLPWRLHVCGRNFQAAGPAGTLDAIRSDGFEPVIVDTGPLAGCPGNACASIGCTTVVYVRVDEDAYVAYVLLGGP
jgi:hypothetical protein